MLTDYFCSEISTFELDLKVFLAAFISEPSLQLTIALCSSSIEIPTAMQQGKGKNPAGPI